jgi:hypothetical protein
VSRLPSARRLCLALAILVAGAVVTVALVDRAVPARAAAGALVGEPYFGAPTETMLGTSPLEAPGEAWAIAPTGTTLVRYTDATGWERLPALPGVQLRVGAAAGRTTPVGGVAVAATDPEEGGDSLVVRDPGTAPRVAPAPDEETLLPGDGLFADGPLLAAYEAPANLTGAYVVPAPANAIAEAVLDWDGGVWSREPICVGTAPGPACEAPPSASFKVLAIDAAGAQAWLLAKGADPEEGIELFRREEHGGVGATAVWRQQELGPSGSLGALFAKAAPPGAQITPRTSGQPLTVSPQGVWIDAEVANGVSSSDATLFFDVAKGEVTASWCDLTAPAGLCSFPLAAELPSGQGRSFAFPGVGPYGQRVITGLRQGAILSLEGTVFLRVPLGGGDAGGADGAALSAADEGWLGDRPPLRLTRNPQPAHLQPWPVAFRRPLTAIAAAPGSSVGGLESEAIAVGAEGQAARYVPGVGWEPEFLLTGSGRRATPTLRAVAWPESERANAVGDEGEMWQWTKATGLWEPDPATPPDLLRANFTGIAFDPANPSRGYAVGKQGLLLAYGRQWTREPLPIGVPPEANFTSVAFAGSEAIATWKQPVNEGNEATYSGGVIVNAGDGWHADSGATSAFGTSVPQVVSGLPDGGAAIAAQGEGLGQTSAWVIEREGPGAPWVVAPGGAVGFPAALAAYRENGRVRAVVSVAREQLGLDLGVDKSQVFGQPESGQPPLLTSPYKLPGDGLLVRQTGDGWQDEQHQAFPLPETETGRSTYDLPLRPDPTLALLLSPQSGEGWAVGGVTGSFVSFNKGAVQTANVSRYGSGAAPSGNAKTAPLTAPTGTVNFAVGGHAQCAGPCADLSATGIGPDRWLRSALVQAAGVGGVRGFLYTGAAVAAGESGPLATAIGPLGFAAEESAYAGRLATPTGGMPVFPAPSSSDLDGGGTLATYLRAFSGFGAPLGAGPAPGGVGPISPTAPEKAYYSFDSSGTGGDVRVIVLDYSGTQLGATQRCWLAGELSAAGAAADPAVVVGSRDLTGQASNGAGDAVLVARILLGGVPSGCATPAAPSSASAYFFDFPEQNRQFALTVGGRSIPAYGSGTLGYVGVPRGRETDFVGAGGFLVAAVNVAARDAATNVAPVTVQLVPNIGSLAVNPTDGTLLRRSQPALFQALARRPQGGEACRGSGAPALCEGMFPDPYVPIPSECSGARCASGLFPEYSFESSNPEVAQFVSHDPASTNPRNVLLVNEKPVADPRSGLLCPFNAGQTTVTVKAGGLAYSTLVTVQPGTVQRPCGTVPLAVRTTPAAAPVAPPPPALAPNPAPNPPPPAAPNPPPPPAPPVPPPPPTPPAPPAPVPHPVPHPTPTPQPLPTPIVPTPAPVPRVAIVPPPGPPAFQPTPPTGTAPISQPVEEEEDEVEIEQVGAQMSALSRSGENGLDLQTAAVPVIAVLLAAGVVSARPRRRRRQPRLATVQNSKTRRRY